jgi:hypothetical protein
MALDTYLSASNAVVQDFTLYERATPSFVLPLGSKTELAGNGYIEGAASSGDLTPPFTYGLKELRLETALKDPVPGMNAFVFDVGRMPFSDPSGYILSSPADGVSFAFKYPGFDVAFRSAYTGFLFLKDTDAPISMSLADATRISEDKDLFGSPRFLVQADLGFPELFGQKFVFSFLSQNDLNPSDLLLSDGSTTPNASMGGRLDTQYFELKADGTISVVSYGAFFAYGSGRTLSWLSDHYGYASIASFLTGAQASFPVAAIPLDGATIGCQVVVASGDKNATSSVEGNTSSVFNRFTPISPVTTSDSAFGAVFLPQLGNLILGGVSLAATPTIGSIRFDGLFKLLTFFRPTSGPVSVSGIDPASTSSYLGSEADLSLSYRFFSDLGVSLTTGIFLPGTAFDSSDSGLQYSCSLMATLTI